MRQEKIIHGGGVYNRQNYKDAKDICTVLVMGCDEYFDVLELNGEFRDKYYADCTFRYFCCTQTKRPSGKYDKIILNDASDVWSVRLHNALKLIDTPYVLLVLDDFFFSKKINEEKIVEYITFMEENNVGELKLTPDDKKRYSAICRKNDEFVEYWKDNPFRVSITAGIWKIEFLHKIILPIYSVWEAERNGIEESRKYDEQCWGVKENSFALVHCIMSGGWTRQARKLFKAEHIKKEKYASRRNQPWYIYCKGIIYNIMTTIAPTLTMDLIRKLKVGRK